MNSLLDNRDVIKKIAVYAVVLVLVGVIVMIILINTTDIFKQMDVTNIYQVPQWGLSLEEMEAILKEEDIAYGTQDIAGYIGIVFFLEDEGKDVECTYIFCNDIQIGYNNEYLDTHRLVMVQYYIYDVDKNLRLGYYNKIIKEFGQPVDSNFHVAEYGSELSYAFWELDQASINAGQVDDEDGKDIMYLCYNVSPVGREAFKQYITDIILY